MFPPPGSGKFEQKPEFEFMGPEGSTTITGFYTEVRAYISRASSTPSRIDETTDIMLAINATIKAMGDIRRR